MSDTMKSNLDGLKAKLDFDKGKHAENAKNFETTTGQAPSVGGNANEIKGQMAKKEEEPTTQEEAASSSQ